jgi:hydrogenase-4 component E
MHSLSFDIAHLLAGSLVLVSFLQLYQDRLYSLLNIFALHALMLALSVAWQAYVQGAPYLFVTALIALVFKAIIIPVALHRIIVRLGIHREIEKVVGVGTAMLLGMALVALAMVVMLRVTAEADPLAREDLAFALSVVLLGLLMMITGRNAVSQVVGFMSLENGLVLAATGAKGMPLVVDAHHVRGVHDECVQRKLHRPRTGSREADGDLSALLSRDVSGPDVRDEFGIARQQYRVNVGRNRARDPHDGADGRHLSHA